MKTLEITQEQKIVNFLNELKTEICITDYVNVEEIDLENAFDSIQEQIEENNGFEIGVIYYSVAIDYLQENDPSLRESLELAEELGFKLSNISSEVLASLLKSQNVRNEFNDLRDEITDFFNELNN